jgi:hypothetical protein
VCTYIYNTVCFNFQTYIIFSINLVSGFSPCFFLTIVVVQNVPLRMTGSSMTTGSDIGPEVRVSRPFFRVFSDFRGFSLCCVVLQGCFNDPIPPGDPPEMWLEPS